MVLQDNFFIEKILPRAILRKLSAEEMAEYRRPFAEPGEGRRPTLTWPREIPIEGDPADVTAIATAYADWLTTSDVPKAVHEGRARCAPWRRCESGHRPLVASADRGDGQRCPFRPGRFAGRDRAGYRRLDGNVRLRRPCSDTSRNNRTTKDVSVVLAIAPLPLLADDVAALNCSLTGPKGRSY